MRRGDDDVVGVAHEVMLVFCVCNEWFGGLYKGGGLGGVLDGLMFYVVDFMFSVLGD